MPPAARRPSRVPPPIVFPAPPADVTTLDPLMRTWPADLEFQRCYDIDWGAREFHAGTPSRRGRFHPVTPADASDPLPVLYGASDVDGALSETVFHDVPVRGTKHVPYAMLLHRLVVALVPLRNLTLVDLTSPGLRRLGLEHRELIDSDPRSYPATAAWARALHDHPTRPDGLLWVSRQHNTSTALVLFGDRVPLEDLTAAPGSVPLTLGAGDGLDAVCLAANRAGITITELP
ncbi:RES domain-containing protein [Modestobacter sp. DSM 44400]|uniref:RES family NAD+ phosphorylase n=1 Tax=Modestobacter sp. DSM 44400 TaxID=1550230 RepID=UPI00089620AB|nr:RES family NAD+ phosphorylase [Modestobacter sp. DSM 44400]SDY85067.1 RES domain-containing protein [Modestobacter sp. DSM 44400]